MRPLMPILVLGASCRSALALMAHCMNPLNPVRCLIEPPGSTRLQALLADAMLLKGFL